MCHYANKETTICCEKIRNEINSKNHIKFTYIGTFLYFLTFPNTLKLQISKNRKKYTSKIAILLENEQFVQLYLFPIARFCNTHNVMYANDIRKSYQLAKIVCN